jgi:hypothetical protein
MTLRRSNRSAHGQQRGHVVHADHNSAALRSVRPARHHRLTPPVALQCQSPCKAEYRPARVAQSCRVVTSSSAVMPGTLPME